MQAGSSTKGRWVSDLSFRGKSRKVSGFIRLDSAQPTAISCCDFFRSLSAVEGRSLDSFHIWKYNNIRPHDSLKNVTPRAFLLKYGKLPAAQAEAEYPTFQQGVYDDNYYF
jgi:transposase InsO family protein